MNPSPPAQPAAEPRVSIVIPVWNGADTLPALLEAVAAQETDFSYDTLAHLGSKDGLPAVGNIGIGPYTMVVLSQ